MIRYSSNIGIVGFGERLTPREKYETLRDFGLGRGDWRSVAGRIGWDASRAREVEHVPRSVDRHGIRARCYSAAAGRRIWRMANGGELLEPHVIKEIRSPTGTDLSGEAPRAAARLLKRSC